MDVATALAVAQTLFATLQCAEVRKLCSIIKYESELEKLIQTVDTIKSALRDADSKCQELTYGGQNWVNNLKDAVYDADDLLDEFNTVAHQLEKTPGGKIMKKVRRFFSSNNQLKFAVNMSKEIETLREKLDGLAKNRRDFGFSELYKPLKVREDTCSYVYEQDIIGRDVDKEAIVDLLLKDDSENNVSFVTIVGIGGLGKTALAQLVFSDHRIKDAFEDEMYWVCVSLNFDTKDILSKMLEMNDNLGFEGLHKKVRNMIKGKIFLLVLDDVWYEDGKKWDELKNFLILGGRGSRILVTSRSLKVARAIGNYPIHELRGLSVEDSWVLFKRISLGQREDEDITDLVEIGRDIVKKCANVPLSIRVVAGLLRDQDIATWQSFKCNDLANMCGGEEGIMPTLMFSYYHLAPELKCCFSFCSLFPEDHVIHKTELIQLWMAQGYLVPSANNGSMEDVGEKYISILLHRCFFQDIEKDKCGEVESFKMHDLMHELAIKVSAKESSTLTACKKDLEGKVRHLFVDIKERHYIMDSNADDEYMNNSEGLTTWFHSSKYRSKALRTYLRSSRFVSTTSDENAIISKCRRLRVLDLRHSLKTRVLSDAVGKLLHLRYLDLSYTYELEVVPESITKLHNLQTLKVIGCGRLKELPEDTRKLVSLRVLDIKECPELTHMPAGMDTLTCLHTLTMFVVCEDVDKKGELRDLITLMNNNNLRGDLHIRRQYANVYHNDHMPPSVCMVGELKSSKLRCTFFSSYAEGQETFLESLFFGHGFQEMRVEYYYGTKLPNWPSGLVSIDLTECDKLQYLPSSLSQLCHLKYLRLESLKNLEYIESEAPSPSAKFFPSLETLELEYMPALKGWWGDIRWMEKEAVLIPSFPRLSELNIKRCKRLTHIPPCPRVKELYFNEVDDALASCIKVGGVESNSFCLERFVTDNSRIFNSLGREFVGSVVSIQLSNIEILGTIREAYQSRTSSLRDLDISNCRGLENLGMEHLTNLKSLRLSGNIKGMPWESLHSLSSLHISCDEVTILPKGIQYLTSLQSLFLSCKNLEDLGECFNSLTSLKQLILADCTKLISLPDEMQHLTSLTALEIRFCNKLKSLPEAMLHLTSLATLKIEYCDELKSLPEAMRHLTSLTTLEIKDSWSCDNELAERCREPDGEDWPKICHIPNLHIQ